MKKTSLKKLEARISDLEHGHNAVTQYLETLFNLDTKNMARVHEIDARLLAIESLVQEIAVEMGVDAKAFKQHFQARFDFWYDYTLREVEDHAPGLAAAIDLRDSVSPDIETPYPPLFD